LGLYLIMYPIGRILMETIRLDSPNFFFNGQDSGINIAMALAGATIVLVAGALLARRRARAGEQAG
jgi:prolipoprotein diacylglyceryltransferase